MQVDNTARISVIIPNWNGLRFLPECLESLRRQTYQDFVVILVDNGSTDASVAFVQERYPEVRVIALQANLGFCAAVNVGIRASSGAFVALLNNDTEVDPCWLEKAVGALMARTDIAFCACKMLVHSDPRIMDSAGLFFRVDGVARSIGAGRLDGEEFSKLREVFGACGGAALYRRALFDDVGFFDEDFFLYGDDVDISFRAQLKGHKCLYVPDAVVYHHGSATVGKVSAVQAYHGSKGMLGMVLKSMPGPLIRKHLLRVVAAQLYQIAYFGLRGRGLQAIRGKMAVFAHLRMILEKRRQIMATRQVSVAYIEELMQTDYHDSIHFSRVGT